MLLNSNDIYARVNVRVEDKTGTVELELPGQTYRLTALATEELARLLEMYAERARENVAP